MQKSIQNFHESLPPAHTEPFNSKTVSEIAKTSGDLQIDEPIHFNFKVFFVSAMENSKKVREWVKEHVTLSDILIRIDKNNKKYIYGQRYNQDGRKERFVKNVIIKAQSNLGRLLKKEKYNEKDLLKAAAFHLERHQHFTILLNDLYENYITHSNLWNKNYSVSQRKKVLGSIKDNADKLRSNLSDDIFFNMGNFTNFSEDELDLLTGLLKKISENTNNYLTLSPLTDKGGKPESHPAFHNLMLHLIKIYKLYSHPPTDKLLLWNREEECYEGSILVFIKQYLEIAKIPLPCKSKYLGKIIYREIKKLEKLSALNFILHPRTIYL